MAAMVYLGVPCAFLLPYFLVRSIEEKDKKRKNRCVFLACLCSGVIMLTLVCLLV